MKIHEFGIKKRKLEIEIIGNMEKYLKFKMMTKWKIIAKLMTIENPYKCENDDTDLRNHEEK